MTNVDHSESAHTAEFERRLIIDRDVLRFYLREIRHVVRSTRPENGRGPLMAETLERIDMLAILAALELTGGDETKASHLLGIDLRTLRLGGRPGWADLTVTRIYPKSSPGQSS